MSKKYENLERLIYIVLGVLLTVVFEYASRSPFNAGDGKWHGYNFNLLVYVGALVCAFALFLLSALVIDCLRILSGTPTEGTETRRGSRLLNAVLYGLYSVCGASLLFLIYKIYANECNLYPGTAAPSYLRQEVSHRIYFIVIFAVSAALLFTLSRLTEDSRKNRPFRAVFALIFAVLNGLALYAPNIFTDRGAGAMHIHAVLNSMIHVANHAPYDSLNCSIYGHYGLLCYPLVKLLGGDLYACMQTLAILGFVTFLAFFYVADRLLRSDVMYVFAVLGMTGTTTILTRRGQYFQINPLRLLFPALTLAVVTSLVYHQSKRAKTIFTGLALLAGIGSVIWNFETGLFCVAVLMCVCVFRGFYLHKIFCKETLGRVLLALLFGFVSIAAAWGLVGWWNILHGGTVNTFRQFVYPLFSGTYHVSNLRLALPSVYYLYFFQILLFFLTAVVTLRRQHNGEQEDTAADTIRFAVALSGLSSLIYFINRSAYGNMSITHVQMCLLLASLGEYVLTITRPRIREMLGTPARWLHFVVASVLFGGAVWMAVEGALYLVVCYDYRANSVWKTESMNAGIEEVRAKIPEEALAFGTYVPEIYFQLGRDTHCVVTDWSDMNDLNRAHVADLVEEYNFVFTSDKFDDTDFKLIDTIQIEDLSFRLFERKVHLTATDSEEETPGLAESEAEVVLEA